MNDNEKIHTKYIVSDLRSYNEVYRSIKITPTRAALKGIMNTIQEKIMRKINKNPH